MPCRGLDRRRRPSQGRSPAEPSRFLCVPCRLVRRLLGHAVRASLRARISLRTACADLHAELYIHARAGGHYRVDSGQTRGRHGRSGCDDGVRPGAARAGMESFWRRRLQTPALPRWFAASRARGADALAVCGLTGARPALEGAGPLRRGRRADRAGAAGAAACPEAVRPRARRPADQVWPETGVKLFAEALPDPCIVLDRRGVVRYANRRAVSRLRRSGPATR